MSATLLAALWAHLAACVLLMGSCCFLLLAGCPRTPTAFRWDERIAAWCRLLVLAAIFSGVVWLLARTAVFENRPDAALEARAVWHVVLDTWPGLVWLARHGLLIVLGAFMAVGPDVTDRRPRRGAAAGLAGAGAGQRLQSRRRALAGHGSGGRQRRGASAGDRPLARRPPPAGPAAVVGEP